MNFIRENVSNAIRRISGKEVPSPAIIKSISQEAGKNELAIRGDIFWYFDELELRDEHLRNKTVLDVGSADAAFAEYCEKKFSSQVVCIDIKEGELGKNHARAVAGDARKLPFKDESFDLVVSAASMPHLFAPYRDDITDELIPIIGVVKEKALEDILAVFRESYRVTKNKGQIRMGTFSDVELLKNSHNYLGKDFKYTDAQGIEKVHNSEDEFNQMLDRAFLIKEALTIF